MILNALTHNLLNATKFKALSYTPAFNMSETARVPLFFGERLGGEVGLLKRVTCSRVLLFVLKQKKQKFNLSE
jgi:hypothetical protein